MNTKSTPLIFLMGPTASGKTSLAVQMVQRFPCEIVSVDSAMVYRGFDIGSAKPNPAIRNIAPHRLIDIRDPAEIYSAGQFRADAMIEIEQIMANKKIPLLVGGTMLYFRILQQGIAPFPPVDAALRAQLQTWMEKEGALTLHEALMRIDPAASNRIHVQDKQRILRALEIYHLTGKTISHWQRDDTHALSGYTIIPMALAPTDRSCLHGRIAARCADMLANGFEAEARGLYERGDLSLDLPSMRSVGYRQMWAYFRGDDSYAQMQEKMLAATRQLAKRQLTWLRSWPEITWLDSEAGNVVEEVEKIIYKRSLHE